MLVRQDTLIGTDHPITGWLGTVDPYKRRREAHTHLGHLSVGSALVSSMADFSVKILSVLLPSFSVLGQVLAQIPYVGASLMILSVVSNLVEMMLSPYVDEATKAKLNGSLVLTLIIAAVAAPFLAMYWAVVITLMPFISLVGSVINLGISIFNLNSALSEGDKLNDGDYVKLALPQDLSPNLKGKFDELNQLKFQEAVIRNKYKSLNKKSQLSTEEQEDIKQIKLELHNSSSLIFQRRLWLETTIKLDLKCLSKKDRQLCRDWLESSDELELLKAKREALLKTCVSDAVFFLDNQPSQIDDQQPSVLLLKDSKEAKLMKEHCMALVKLDIKTEQLSVDLGEKYRSRQVKTALSQFLEAQIYQCKLNVAASVFWVVTGSLIVAATVLTGGLVLPILAACAGIVAAGITIKSALASIQTKGKEKAHQSEIESRVKERIGYEVARKLALPEPVLALEWRRAEPSQDNGNSRSFFLKASTHQEQADNVLSSDEEGQDTVLEPDQLFIPDF